MTRGADRMRRGFTLIELMLVIMIMAMLGTIAVGGYRGMRRGIAERGVLQSAGMFIRGAFQRSQIDRVPVLVCFWNETTAEETDDEATRVSGRAVAVRRGGRLTDVKQNKFLIDEFGDLETFRYVDEEGEYDDDEALKNVQADNDGGNATFLYRMTDGSQIERSLVSQITVPFGKNEPLASDGINHAMKPFSYYLIDAGGVNWRPGDAYGIAFDEITLPTGFIFGGDGSYSKTIRDPVSGKQCFLFEPGESSSKTIEISELRPQDNGSFKAVSVGKTESPVAR